MGGGRCFSVALPSSVVAGVEWLAQRYGVYSPYGIRGSRRVVHLDQRSKAVFP